MASIALLVAATPVLGAPRFNGRIAVTEHAFTSVGSILTVGPSGGAVSAFSPAAAAGARRSPTWSPDGKRLAMIIRTSAGDRLYVADAAGVGARWIGPGDSPGGQVLEGPAWSPDGRQIALTYTGPDSRNPALRYTRIIVVDANGTNAPIDVSNRFRTPDIDQEVAWSPDGTRLAYAKVGDARLADGIHVGIFVTTADGRGRESRISVGGRAPAWSPDGTQIAFHEAGGAGTTVGNPSVPDLYVVDPYGAASPKLLMPDARDAAWSPDPGRSTRIAFTKIVSGTSQPWVLDPYAHLAGRLGGGTGNFLTWSPDGAYVLVDNGLSTIYRVTAVTGRAVVDQPLRLLDRPGIRGQISWQPLLTPPAAPSGRRAQ